MTIDAKDRKILELLEADCRISNQELANKVGMSSSACWRKVKSLEEAGIIERYGAIVNPKRMGMNFTAMVHVQLTRHDPDEVESFLGAVARRREIQSCYATTGQADYHLLITCEDIDAFNRFQEEFLFRMKAISSAQTNVVLKEIPVNTNV